MLPHKKIQRSLRSALVAFENFYEGTTGFVKERLKNKSMVSSKKIKVEVLAKSGNKVKIKVPFVEIPITVNHTFYHNLKKRGRCEIVEGVLQKKGKYS